MYYVNEEEIREKLDFISFIRKSIHDLLANWRDRDICYDLAQERILHLAVETVTDIGSCLIDGFMMREAASYEDIIVVLKGESVFPEETGNRLLQLVRLRKPLVQQYTEWKRGEPHPLLPGLPEVLAEFRNGVQAFMERERL